MTTICEDEPASIRLQNLTCLTDLRSPVQHIQYFRSEAFGRVLVIDGEIQHVEAWAPFYHETVVHLPCSFLRETKRALILGGGDLFAAGELLKYRAIEAVHLVDFDAAVTGATIEVYDGARATASDPRLKIIAAKAEDYLSSCRENYDLVINDAVDLAHIDCTSQQDLYQDIERVLSTQGICSDLIYRSIYDTTRFRYAMAKVKYQDRSAISLVCVPEYPGIFHILTMWGNCRRLSQRSKQSINIEHPRLRNSGAFQYFDPTYLSYYLYTPPYLKKYIK